MASKYVIGIDPGVNTGFAIRPYRRKSFIRVESMKILDAFDLVLYYHYQGETHVFFEDARLRGGKNNPAILQGVGSVKRDCSIWEDFLEKHKIPYYPISPLSKGAKWDSAQFRKRTGWDKQTNSHSRDAAVICLDNKPVLNKSNKSSN